MLSDTTQLRTDAEPRYTGRMPVKDSAAALAAASHCGGQLLDVGVDQLPSAAELPHRAGEHRLTPDAELRLDPCLVEEDPAKVARGHR